MTTHSKITSKSEDGAPSKKQKTTCGIAPSTPPSSVVAPRSIGHPPIPDDQCTAPPPPPQADRRLIEGLHLRNLSPPPPLPPPFQADRRLVASPRLRIGPAPPPQGARRLFATSRLAGSRRSHVTMATNSRMAMAETTSGVSRRPYVIDLDLAMEELGLQDPPAGRGAGAAADHGLPLLPPRLLYSLPSFSGNGVGARGGLLAPIGRRSGPYPLQHTRRRLRLAPRAAPCPQQGH